MGTCNFCQEQIEHPFPCNYCGSSFCGEHRLPENHQCPDFSTDDTNAPLASASPNITDRRGTWGRLVSRVRDKETSKRETGADTSRHIESQRDFTTDSEATVLNCSQCGNNVASLVEASCCGRTMCRECRDSHDCNCSDPERIESSGDRGIIRRLVNWLRAS